MATQFDFSSSQIPHPLVGACAWCPADTYTRLHEITIILMDKHTRLGMDSGVCENCEKLDALWSLLRLLWNRSRAIVATCLTDYSIQFCILSVHGYLLSQLISNFHKKGSWGNSRWGDRCGEYICREFWNYVRKKSIKHVSICFQFVNILL